jgi:SAM-dependent methyltransferase
MLDHLRAVIEHAATVRALDDASFAEFCQLWQAANESLKDAVYAGPSGGAPWMNRVDFENLWGAQSVIFMTDILPHFHRKLVEHHRRPEVLKVLDVGAASGFGSRFLASLHRDHSIYSQLDVEAIDISPGRKRWIQATAPDVKFRVADLFEQPSRAWDFVVCSHVIEHIENPRPFIEKLADVCRGFAFVYSPFAEEPRIKAHASSITEADYAGLPCEFHRIKSVGWHPNRPDDYCLLAIIDCRGEAKR